MKFIFTLLLICLFSAIQAQEYPIEKFSNHEEFGKWMDNHPFNIRPPLTKKEIKAMPKADRPDLAAEQDFLRTLDPILGYPPKERLIPVLKKVKAYKEDQNQRSAPGSPLLPWVERGPTNVAGRTRAIAFDPNDVGGNKVFAGGVAGGLWYNNDITNTNSPWNKIDDFWDNIAVSTICFDPSNTQIAYVGTGEGWFNIDAVRGYGIWKTADGGTTWNHLASTTGSAFNYVQKVVVHPANGDVYAATRNGLRRSQDGGTSWSEVLGSGNGSSSDRFADVEIAANNTIYTSAGLGNTDGIYKSTSGNSGTWTKLNTGANGFPISDIKRIELALAPSNANVIYAVAQSGTSAIKGLYRSDDQGSNWVTLALPNDADGGISANDFSRGQAWYDLTAAVDPNNSANVVVGAIDLFKSTNSGGSWTQISHWYGGYGFPYVHADQHALVFKPGSSSTLINGNDGGVFYTSNFNLSTPSWSHPTLNYNVTQFYSCAINPDAGSSNFLAGSQDNGTQKFTQPGFGSTTTATGGDGGFCFIDQTEPNIQITSYVYNTFYVSTNGGSSFNSIMNDGNTGSFINPADYDDNLNILYTYKSSTALRRVTGIGTTNTVGDLNLSFGSSVRHIRVSPYTTSSTTLFVGTSAGKIYKVTDADGGSAALVDIDTDSELPIGSISCIEIGANENELLVTFSNFGVNSVWYTNDGGINWISKEGDLPDMPVRWAVFLPNVSNEVILATEVGVWSTANISAPSPTWVPSNTGLANTRVDMLQHRASDFEIIAATHGRGLFSSTSALLELDLSVQTFINPSSELCDSVFTPGVIFENSGQTALTSAQFELYINDLLIETISWNGNLPNGSQASVTFLENTSTAGNHTIRVESSLPNGGIDENLLNDLLELDFTVFSVKEAEYLNDLEDNIVPPNDWLLVNPDGGISWEYWDLNTSYDCVPSVAAIIRHFHYGGSGQIDEMISPPVAKGLYDDLKLVFDYAHGQIFANDNSQLEIFASGDCGNTWNLKWSKSGDDLATALDSIWFFAPFCEEWARDTVDLSEYDQTGVMVKFVATNGGAGNIYLDNINITGDILGCTDPNALNYNPISNVDDGSCFYCDLAVDIGILMDSCISTNDISLTANPVSNISSVFTYSWVEGFFNEISTEPTAIGLSEGYYYVIVTDEFNCTAFEEVTLSEYGITDVEVLGQGVCEQLTNTYIQDLRITYLPYPNIFNFNINVNGQVFPVTGSPQIVTLTNLSANGLSVDVDAFITDNVDCVYSVASAFVAPQSCAVDCTSELQYSVVSNDYCINDVGGSIDLTVTTNNPPAVISWTGPNGFTSSASNLTNLDLGMYYLNITDAFCTKEDSVWVDGYGITNITSLTQSVCDPLSNSYSQTLEVEYLEFNNYDSFSLIVNGSLFSLTGSPQQIVLSGLIADDQPVDVSAHITNSVTCAYDATSLFTAPTDCSVNCETDLQFSLSGTDYCINDAGGNVNLSLGLFTNPVSFSWVGPNGFTSSAMNLSDIEQGLYIVTVTDAYCAKEDSIQIEAFGVTSISVLGQTACEPLTNTYSQDLDITYEEFPGYQNFLVNVNGNTYTPTGSPQLITLSGLTANGQTTDATAFLTNDATCSFTLSNAFTAPVECGINCENDLQFSLTATNYCNSDAGGTVNMNLSVFTNPVSFLWTGPNSFTSSFMNLSDVEEGWYIVSVTDSNCVKQDSIEVEAYGINAITSVFQSPCDPQTNTYDQILQIDYAEFSGYENFQLSVNGNLYAASGSPQQVTLTDLNADGQPVDVIAYLTNDVSCFSIESDLFTAPSDCSINCETALQFNLSGTNYCVNDAGGTVNLNLSAFTAPVNFSWTGPNSFTSTSMDLVDVEKGWYVVTVTDANCSKQDSIQIESFGVLGITSISQSSCESQTNTYDQIIEISYEEFTGYENFFINVNGGLFAATGSPQQVSMNGLFADGLPVDVTAFLTNEASCFSIAPNLFTAPTDCFIDCETALLFSLSGTDYCVNDAGGTINLTLISFTNPGSFSWTGPNGFTSNLLTLVDLEKGWYHVTVTDANCVKQDSIEIEAYGITNVTSISQTACESVTNTYDQVLEIAYEEFTGYNNFQLVVNASPYTPAGSPQQITLTGLNADGFPVNVTAVFTNDLSCVYSGIGLFTAPSECTIDCETDLDFTLSKTDYCVNDVGGSINTNLIAFTNPVSFSWVGPNGFTSTDVNLSNVQEGLYTLTVTDANCVKQSTIILESYGISAITTVSQSACDSQTNTYDQVLEITFEEFSGFENYFLNVNGLLFTPVSSPQQISLTGLVADGLDVDVTAFMTNNVSCTTTINQLFTAPESCTAVDCDTALVFNLTPTDFCQDDLANGNIVVDISAGTPPYNFSWMGPAGFSANTQNISNLENGSYTLTLTDQLCEKSTSALIFEYGVTNVSQAGTTVCDIQTNTYSVDLSIEYLLIPGIGSYDLIVNGISYNILGSPQTVSLSGLPTDGLDFEVDVHISNDPACVYNDPALFTAPTGCNCLTQVDLGPDSSLCEGETLILTTAGGNFVDYLWSDASTSSSLLVSTSGTYYVDVIDDVGCSSSDTIIVSFLTPPVVSAGPDLTICPGENTFLNGSVSPVSVSNWQVLSGSGTISDTTQLNTEASNLSLGENVFQLEVNDNICGLISDVVSVHVEDAMAPTVSCSADLTVVVNAMPYIMEDLTSAITFSDNCPGILTPSQSPVVGTELITNQVVTFTVTDENNNSGQCSLNLILDYQTICTDGFYPAPVNLQNVVVPGGYDLTWDPVPGSIVCQIKGGPLGGGDFASLIVWGPEVSSKTIDVNELTPGVSYQWKVRCACATQPSIIAGPFSVYDFFTVPIENAPFYKKTESDFIEILSLFPNPAFNEIEILFDLDNDNSVKVEVIDILGTIVYSSRTTGLKGQNYLSVALDNLPSGNYYLKISNSKNISGSHFVISR